MHEVGIRVLRRLAALLAIGALLAASLAAPAAIAAKSTVVARVTFSFACNATGDPFCSPDYFGFRYTAELRSDGTGTTQGSFNLHQRGGPAGGGDSINDEIEWTATTGALNLVVAVDPSDLYFNLGFGTLSFPQTAGHYSYHPVPGITSEVTVIRY